MKGKQPSVPEEVTIIIKPRDWKALREFLTPMMVRKVKETKHNRNNWWTTLYHDRRDPKTCQRIASVISITVSKRRYIKR